ncbi:hypothetical protein ABZP36_009609 [Zizania latifolia]
MPTPCSSSRAKRATAPLDAAARARLAVLPGSADSSGSEHEPAAALSSLVNEYLLQGADDATVPSSAAVLQLAEEGSDAEDDEHSSGRGSNGSAAAVAEVVEEIKGVLDAAGRSGDDVRRRRIFADVVDAMRGLEDVRGERSAFRRAVMSRLRECGHDAGLCKARWDKTSNMAAGSYEYIDVVDAAAAAPETARYIVDVGFAREFEVARPTEHYEAVRAALPEVLVATPGDVRKVVRAASAAVRRSLKRRGLSVPPWRKRKFMLAKWLGPYRRTVNAVPASAGTAVAGGGAGASAVCRTVLGFAPPPRIMTSPALWGIDVPW